MQENFQLAPLKNINFKISQSLFSQSFWSELNKYFEECGKLIEEH